MQTKTILAVLLLSAAAAAAAAAPFRGVYLHPGAFADEKLTPAEREQLMDAALDKVKACGFTTLVPYANTSSGKAFWPNKVGLPLAGAPDFDTLGILAQKARDRGLKVMPAVCVLISGHETPAGVLESHPGWAVAGPDGKPRGYICASVPEARGWVVAMLADMAAHIKPDGIMLDYLRFPSSRSMRLPNSDASGDRLQQEKEAALSKLMAQISNELRARQPGIKLGIYTWGPHVASNHAVAQPWPDWVRDGYLDLINVSGYCYTDNYGDDYMKTFEERLRGAAELAQKAGGKPEMTFALGFRTSHGAIKSQAQIGEYMQAASKAGCPGVAAFAWKSVEPYTEDIKREKYFR